MGNPQNKAALFEQFARVGKALGNGKRLELLDLLAQGERSVESLAAAAGQGLTTASANLQALKHAGLVTTRRDGTRVNYALAGPDVAALYSLVREVAQTRIADVEASRVAYLGLDDEAVGAQREMSRGELLAAVEAGTVTVIDVRPPEEYAAAHVPGALSIPLTELSSRLAELPATGRIVAYCRGAYCVLAYEAVTMLVRRGFRAERLVDGMLEWKLAGLPTSVAA